MTRCPFNCRAAATMHCKTTWHSSHTKLAGDLVISRKQQKLQARAERLAREANLRAVARRRRLRRGTATCVVGLAALGAGIVAAEGGASPTPASGVPAARLESVATLGRLESPESPGPLGPEGVPIPDAAQLAAPAAATPQAPVDGIRCLGSEQLLFHIHAHLTVFVNGVARRIPGGVGIVDPQVSQTPVGAYVGGGNCFYWLHTHAADGIVHIESPVKRTFTLGDFFDVWGQRLSGRQVGPATGTVTAIYNGRAYEGSPRDIPLTRHAQIQLDVGRPLVAPVKIRFPNGLAPRLPRAAVLAFASLALQGPTTRRIELRHLLCEVAESDVPVLVDEGRDLGPGAQGKVAVAGVLGGVVIGLSIAAAAEQPLLVQPRHDGHIGGVRTRLGGDAVQCVHHRAHG